MRYAGFCTIDPVTQFGDRAGYLLREEPDGWYLVAQHISSTPSRAQQDIQWRYDRRSGRRSSDQFEWLGELTEAEAYRRFPAPPTGEVAQP